MDWPRFTYGCWWSGNHSYYDPINISDWKSNELQQLAGAFVGLFTAGWFGKSDIMRQTCDRTCKECGKTHQFGRFKAAGSYIESEWKRKN